MIHTYLLAYWTGFVGLAITPACLDLLMGRTELTPAGVRTRSLFRRRSCRWVEVADVEMRSQSGRGATAYRVVLQRKQGRPVYLVAPTNSGTGRDAAFDEAFETIKAKWLTHTAS